MKAEINTIFVDEERVQEVSERAKERGIKVLPIGKKEELIPGIEVYRLVDTDTVYNPLTDKEGLDKKEYQFDKVYVDEEHRARSEED